MQESDKPVPSWRILERPLPWTPKLKSEQGIQFFQGPLGW
jgi:hypothetical protein